MRLIGLVWFTMLLALVLFCRPFTLDNISLLSLAPTSGASAANSSAAANATALALFSAGAAGLGYYLLRRGRGGSVSFASQQNFSALNSIKSSIGSAIDGIKNFLVKNSDAIKTGSDVAGWVSLGLFIAGAILSLTGVGAVVGVPLMTAAFAVGAGSAAADLAVGAARQSAGVADADDYIRMGLAPLAIIPIGRVAAQPGKMVAKQAGKQIAKNIVRDAKGFKPAAKNLLPKFTREELDKYERWANGFYRQYGGKETLEVIQTTSKKWQVAYTDGKRIYLINKAALFIKNAWKDVMRHEVNHLNLCLPKFQQIFLPNAASRGEILKLISDPRMEQLEEAVVDIISSYQSRTYGISILEWGKKIGKISAGIKTGKPGAVTDRAIKLAKRFGLIGAAKDLYKIKIKAPKMGRILPLVMPIPFVSSQNAKNTPTFGNSTGIFDKSDRNENFINRATNKISSGINKVVSSVSKSFGGSSSSDSGSKSSCGSTKSTKNSSISSSGSSTIKSCSSGIITKVSSAVSKFVGGLFGRR